jgi:multidrug efflux pump subunit AcrB
VNYPISVTAQLPGADPQTMASSVAMPPEEQFGQIPGIVQMTSSSTLGFTSVTVLIEQAWERAAEIEDKYRRIVERIAARTTLVG